MNRLGVSTLGAALLCVGCGTLMKPTRLTQPAHSYEHGLGVQVAEVHVSQDVRFDDFSDSSRVVVVVDLTAGQDTLLELRDARLTITGVTEPGDVRNALATGTGQPPERLVDDEFAPPQVLRSGQYVRAWVAFGGFPARATHEIPERIALDLPTGQHLELSRPGQAPIWKGETQKASSGNAIWLQMSADETAYNFAFSDGRAVAGPVVIGYRLGIGMREVSYRDGTNGDNLVCCNLAVASDVAWPFDVGSQLRIAPFLGVETAFLPQNEDVTRHTWVGPSVGLELSASLPAPLHGPFPIDYERSRLGQMYLRVALVHWFGPDRKPYPSFGAMLSLGHSYGF